MSRSFGIVEPDLSQSKTDFFSDDTVITRSPSFFFLLQSFFGRSYNNLNSITECKNNGECVINKKNRTACKSCRLRKCLLVGMSKSGSRYGRRSNWFKIHCLLQEQQQAAVAQLQRKNSSSSAQEGPPQILSPLGFPHSNLGGFLRPDNPSSPSVSSPDSDSSENGLYSPRVNGSNPFINKDFYLPVPFQSMFLHPPSLTSPFLLPHSMFPFPLPSAKHEPHRYPSPDQVQNKLNSDLEEETDRPSPMHSPTNNNDYSSKNNNNIKDICSSKSNNNNNNNNEEEEEKIKMRSKRFYLDAILGLQNPKMDPILRSPKEFRSPCEIQDDPIDLSVKRTVKKEVEDEKSSEGNSPEPNEEEENEEETPNDKSFSEEAKPIPLDLSV